MADDDPLVSLINGLLLVEIPLILLFFVNLYLANTPNGGFWIGKNSIITITVFVFSLAIAVLSAVSAGLEDTDEETADIFFTLGVMAPGVIIIIYLCIFAYPLIFSRAQSGSMPPAPAAPPTKGGGRRHIRSGKSRK